MAIEHILWLVLAVLFVAFPVLQMMPSPKQKLRAKLRDTALKNGLLVQFAKIPDPEKTQSRQQQQQEPGIAYRWQRPPQDKRQFKTHTSYRVQLHSQASDYQWFNPKLAPDTSCHATLASIFQRLPADVSVVESTPTQISAYWRERGEVADVERIAECLREIHAVERQQLGSR